MHDCSMLKNNGNSFANLRTCYTWKPLLQCNISAVIQTYLPVLDTACVHRQQHSAQYYSHLYLGLKGSLHFEEEILDTCGLFISINKNVTI